mmetsp:Transcript_13274/g.57794  ORF Transcript_13274/g.57794 Transcript_13274/m.57794 type:complete len:118 (+) Transcript_13274:184-537(+)
MGEPLGRHTGYKATVVRVITQRPCFSFFVTLLIALILGGVGFALGAMQIDTEGWETRGTEIADRAMTIKTWKYGKFTLSEGVPLTPPLRIGGARRPPKNIFSVFLTKTTSLRPSSTF